MAQKLKPRKVLRVPSTKNTKSLCKSTCYAVTNLELTSSRILSLLNLNSYTSIAGAVTPRMLSKPQFYFLLKSRHQNWTTEYRVRRTSASIRKCPSCTPCRRRYFIRSLLVSILLRELALPVISPNSISTQHRECINFFNL